MQVWCGIADTKERGRRPARAGDGGLLPNPVRALREVLARTGTAEDVAEFLTPYVDAGCTTFNLIPQAADHETRWPGPPR